MHPPNDINAEASVLGACLLSLEAVEDAQALLSPEKFYGRAHRTIFEAIGNVAANGETPDVVTVAAELGGRLDGVGGVVKLSALVDAVPHARQVNQYARIVHERWMKRELLNISQDIKSLVADNASPNEIIGQVDGRLVGLLDTGGEDTARKIGEFASEHFRELQEAPDETTGTLTGLDALDTNMGGLQPGTLTVIAARPSVGKSALVQQIMLHVSGKLGQHAFLASLEMSKAELAERFICSLAKVDIRRLRMRTLSMFEWERAHKAASEVATYPWIVDDKAHLSTTQLVSRLRRYHREHPVALYAVDYVNQNFLTDPRRRGVSDASHVGYLFAAFKTAAKDLRIPIIAVSQLNRANEHENRRPRLSDLRDSGEIEQHADNVIFIHRQKNSDTENAAELVIAKQRNGPTGVFQVRFVPEQTRFVDSIPGR